MSSDDGTTLTQTEYEYDANGVRVKQTVTIDSGTPVVTEYLIDAKNFTGYAKAIAEYVDGVLNRAYTIGHEVISQTDTAGNVQFLLREGHGDTRQLLGMAANVLETYHFDAYGNAHGFNAATAKTTWLQLDGQRDLTTGLNNNLARWYDPTTGTWKTLDEFTGKKHDPQSFHKYLYTHGDPVNGLDPTGLMSLGQTLGALGVTSTLASISIGAVVGAGVFGGLSEDDFIWDDVAEGAIVGGSIGLAFRVAKYRKNLGETFANGMIAGFVDLGTTYFLNGLIGLPQPTWQSSAQQFLRAFQAGVMSTAFTGLFDTDEWKGVFQSFGSSTSIQLVQQSVRYFVDPENDVSFGGYLESVIVPSVSTAIIGAMISSKLSFGFGDNLENSLGQWSASSQMLTAVKRRMKSLTPSQQNALRTQLQGVINGNATARAAAIADVGAKLLDEFLVGVMSGSISTIPDSLVGVADLIGE